MKTIPLSIAALSLAAVTCFLSLSESRHPSEDSVQESAEVKNGGREIKLAEVDIPGTAHHSAKTCKGAHCDHASHKVLVQSEQTCDENERSWPVAVLKHFKKSALVSSPAIKRLSRTIPYKVLDELDDEQIQRLARYAEYTLNTPAAELLHLCWAEDVHPALRDSLEQLRTAAIQEASAEDPQPVFQGDDRWSSTATDGNTGSSGTPVTLTWGFVADGTPIGAASGFAAGTSNLIEKLNDAYGESATGDYRDAPWFELFETSFAYWSAVTGNKYVYVTYDDGNTIDGQWNPGVLNVRPDVRIGGCRLDGNSGTLAYNYYPDSGDMVIDSEDASNLSDTPTTKKRFRNVISHEHGHGLGLAHVCPTNQTKLMEPYANTVFEGVQFDDMLTAQGLYGDFHERSGTNKNNNSAATASDLGTLSSGHNWMNRSISRTGDVDLYKFKVTKSKLMSLRVTPTTQAAYLEGSQDGGCSAGTNFDPRTRQNLSVRVLDTNGTTVLDSANAGGLGQEESLNGLALTKAEQYYYIEVSGGGENDGSGNNAQLYHLDVVLTDATLLSGSGFQIVQENYTPLNQAPDPGEIVTAQIIVKNTGIHAIAAPQVTVSGSANLTVLGNSTKTLQSLGAGASTTVSFQLEFNAACGSYETLTYALGTGSGVSYYKPNVMLGAMDTMINEDFEGSTGLPTNWTATTTGEAKAQWSVSSTTPLNGVRSAFSAGGTSTHADLTTPELVVNGENSLLSFSHRYDFENMYDGGILQIKIANGAWQEWTAAGGSITTNGYAGALDDESLAWTGASAGTLMSTATLPPSAIGKVIRIRWLAKYDYSVDSVGWRIDDINLEGAVCCDGLTPYVAWKDLHFGTNTTNTGDGDDFDGDGQDNLTEYGLGTDPAKPSAGNPAATLVNNGSELELSYQEDVTLTDIQYIAEASPTMGLAPSPWTSTGVTLSYGAEVNGKRTVTARVPASGVRQFMRLRIALK